MSIFEQKEKMDSLVILLTTFVDGVDQTTKELKEMESQIAEIKTSILSSQCEGLNTEHH